MWIDPQDMTKHVIKSVLIKYHKQTDKHVVTFDLDVLSCWVQPAKHGEKYCLPVTSHDKSRLSVVHRHPELQSSNSEIFVLQLNW
jgi:hypothetical protein